ncbi:MAG: hypothetical protein ACR2NP_13430, partial [Pirellulaceae bacterium]
MTNPLSLDAAVAQYRKLATEMYDDLPTARAAFDTFLQFYCDTRVEGASLDDDGDELNIEYGPCRKLGVTQFT